MSSILNRNSVVFAAKEQLSIKLNGESVILDLESGQYYGVKGAASLIWNLLRDPKPVADLINSTLSEYEIGFEQCEIEVLEFLSELVTEGLVDTVSNESL